MECHDGFRALLAWKCIPLDGSKIHRIVLLKQQLVNTVVCSFDIQSTPY